MIEMLQVPQYNPRKKMPYVMLLPTHLTFTCSKPTIETLKKDVKYVQS